jgi:hypothetical protein
VIQFEGENPGRERYMGYLYINREWWVGQYTYRRLH